MPETQAVDPTYWPPYVTGCCKIPTPEVGIEPGPQDLKANTLPRRCKSRLLPQGSRSVLYTYLRHFYCLAVEAGFYSDVVECLPLDPAALVYKHGKYVVGIGI